MVQSTASQVALGWYPDLAALAEAAGVPVEVAQAAQGASLLREEPRGYRPKLAAWLRKLAVLIEAGYAWTDIQAWVERRWTQGHEDEGRWPRGFKP